MGTVFKVCIPHTSRDYFDYHSDDCDIPAGVRVSVPFRNKQRIGVVIGESNAVPSIKTKAIAAILDETPLIPADLLQLCQWVSDYYQSPLSEVLPLAVPKKFREGKSSELPVGEYYHLNASPQDTTEKIKPSARKQLKLFDLFAQHPEPLSKQAILQAGFTTAQINALLAMKLIMQEKRIERPVYPLPKMDQPLVLNEEQQAARDTILDQLHSFQCFLLQGVTGSGKTEVYLQVIERVLASGRQVLVLVPEIGLTPQLLARFSARFTQTMVVIHSHLNDTERQNAWLLAQAGIAKLVIGTRTAVFTPMPDLGLIIIDEEHDSSLKQMDGVRYSARDTALMRAHSHNIPVILGSATPSLESLNNCLAQKYQHLILPNRAVSTVPLKFEIMDIRNKPLKHGIAASTLDIIKKHLTEQNQVLVFINRRGFAPVLICHHCGWMADCKACDSHMTLHQAINKLICHHCGLAHTIPKRCKACQSEELLPVGAGTQRVHEYLSAEFPQYRVLRVDRDEVRQKSALDSCLDAINKGDAQLIVGTQMLAKGHHFPRLTLVVILDADNGFYNQDFRALERLGQLITQVAGRAGREDKPGQVVIQTHLPHNPMLNCLIQNGYTVFSETLLEQRRLAELPPYHYLAVIRAQSKVLPKALSFLHELKNNLKNKDVISLGPAPAPLARKADYYRMQLLIKSPSRKKLQAALTELRSWLTINNRPNGIRWNIDVDPMDLT